MLGSRCVLWKQETRTTHLAEARESSGNMVEPFEKNCLALSTTPGFKVPLKVQPGLCVRYVSEPLSASRVDGPLPWRRKNNPHAGSHNT